MPTGTLISKSVSKEIISVFLYTSIFTDSCVIPSSAIEVIVMIFLPANKVVTPLPTTNASFELVVTSKEILLTSPSTSIV